MAFKLQDYYRITKPGIIYGNLLTATAGYLFASRWQNQAKSLIGMLIGLGLIIAAGCVFNNILDREIDALMERTKHRAIVKGTISTKVGLTYACILGLTGAITLGITTNSLAVVSALFGLFCYVVVYGIAKRRTVYSTLIGSLAGAIPPLVGYVAFTGSLDAAAIVIVLILVCWQVAHFYGIALYREAEYRKARLPIWSVVNGEASTQLQALIFMGLFGLFAVSLYLFAFTGYTYLIIMMVTDLAWVWYCVISLNRLTPKKWGRRVFLSSLIVILITSVALAIGSVAP